MMTIGQQLQQARLALDMSVEDVAFRTHIPAGQVRDMENDDLSHFANLTYARGFLKLYSQYLGLDITEHLSQFSTQEFSHASGHEYVQTAKATMNLPAAVFTDYGRARRPGLYLLLLTALGAGGVWWWNNRGGKPSDNSTGAKVEAAAEKSPPATTRAAPDRPVSSGPQSNPAPAAPAAAVANTPPAPAVEPVAASPVPKPGGKTDPAAASLPAAPPAKAPKAVVVEEEETETPPKRPN